MYYIRLSEDPIWNDVAYGVFQTFTDDPEYSENLNYEAVIGLDPLRYMQPVFDQVI